MHLLGCAFSNEVMGVNQLWLARGCGSKPQTDVQVVRLYRMIVQVEAGLPKSTCRMSVIVPLPGGGIELSP